MATFELSTGAISKLLACEYVKEPIFKIITAREIVGGDGISRARLTISDGIRTFDRVVLPNKFTKMILDGTLCPDCAIRAENICVNKVNDKQIIVILELTVLGQNNSGTQATSNCMEILDSRIIPIQHINAYTCWDLSIRARVINKSPIRLYNNRRGKGEAFFVTLLDGSEEIRMSGFNDCVKEFYDELKVGNIYTISNFQVRSMTKKFLFHKNDYEILFNHTTRIHRTPTTAHDATIPPLAFDFVDFATVHGLQECSIVDVIGICYKTSFCYKYHSKTCQKAVMMRKLFLVDCNFDEIQLIVWDTEAKSISEYQDFPVIAAKRFEVLDVDGKILSFLDSSTWLINPNIAEARRLHSWFKPGKKELKSTYCVPLSTNLPVKSTLKLLLEAHKKDINEIDGPR